MAQVTADSERINQLSEKDVINVLEIVLNEYPINHNAMFLSGHSMGSGGTWYIGGKYPDYWKALAPMSGPFVQETGYPWESIRRMKIFITEGTQAPSLDASRLLRNWMSKNGFSIEYKEVNADHGGMIPLVLPNVFEFFNQAQNTTPKPTTVATVKPTPVLTPSAYPGDVNGNGTVDIVDALIVAQYCVGIIPTNFKVNAADVNCSGDIDIVDALRIAQYTVGLFTLLPC